MNPNARSRRSDRCCSSHEHTRNRTSLMMAEYLAHLRLVSAAPSTSRQCWCTDDRIRCCRCAWVRRRPQGSCDRVLLHHDHLRVAGADEGTTCAFLAAAPAWHGTSGIRAASRFISAQSAPASVNRESQRAPTPLTKLPAAAIVTMSIPHRARPGIICNVQDTDDTNNSKISTSQD
jgi:hypothetical protein